MDQSFIGRLCDLCGCLKLLKLGLVNLIKSDRPDMLKDLCKSTWLGAFQNPSWDPCSSTLALQNSEGTRCRAGSINRIHWSMLRFISMFHLQPILFRPCLACFPHGNMGSRTASKCFKSQWSWSKYVCRWSKFPAETAEKALIQGGPWDSPLWSDSRDVGKRFLWFLRSFLLHCFQEMIYRYPYHYVKIQCWAFCVLSPVDISVWMGFRDIPCT